jgi:TetR/AcrR family transcriptional regulator, fatty acid metabolism regulator protein
MERSTQTAVLDAAVSCFAERGFKKTSVDTIASQADVAKGTVYLYCDSKEDLFYQAVHRELVAWSADLSRLLDPRRPAPEILVEIATRDAEFLAARPLTRDLISGVLAGQLPAWKPQFDELQDLACRHAVELLHLGIRQGLFAADLDIEATARVLVDLQLAGALLGHRSDLDPELVRRRQLATVRIVLGGLETRPTDRG